MPYYRKFTPTADGQWMIVIGVMIGAFLSANLSVTIAVLVVPPCLCHRIRDGSGLSLPYHTIRGDY